LTGGGAGISVAIDSLGGLDCSCHLRWFSDEKLACVALSLSDPFGVKSSATSYVFLALRCRLSDPLCDEELGDELRLPRLTLLAVGSAVR